MKAKLIATIMALGMVATAFTMLVPIAAAQPSHPWITSTDGGASGDIANAVDLTSPDEGLGRHYIQTRPGEIALGPTIPNPASSHDRIGALGTSMTPNMAQIDSEGFASPSMNGDPTIFIAERDTTAPLRSAPPISVQISSMAGGNVPNGYVACSPVYSYLWIEPMGFGQFGAMTLTKIPSPTVTAAQVSWVAPAGVPNIYGYGILQSANNNGPWVELGQSIASPYACVPIASNWYSLVIYWQGTGAGFLNTQSVRGAVFGAPTQFAAAATTFGPETTIAAETGAVLIGNISNEFVTISATITDTEVPADNIIGAEILIGGTTYAMSTVSAPGSSRVYTYQYDLPNGQLVGAVPYTIHGQDDADGWNATWTADSFTYTDTTKPYPISWGSTPGATVPYNTPAVFTANYADFSAYNALIANSYISYTTNNTTTNFRAWGNLSFAFGSFTNVLNYTIPGNTFTYYTYVNYSGRIYDSNGNFQILSGGNFMVMGAGAAVQDPYPIYGYVSMYNGSVGAGYNPILSGINTVVTARWINSTSGLPSTRSNFTDATGQFSIDILNYTDLGFVEVSAVFNGLGGNQGHNWTQIDITNFPAGAGGGRQQNVTCGVPYLVEYVAPPLVGVQFTPLPITYRVLDRDGAVAQGYYTRVVGNPDGPMNFGSGDVAFVNNVLHPYTFDGIGGPATDGFFTGNVAFGTLGAQWLLINENGLLEAPINDFPSLWGGFTQRINDVIVPGWIDDWANTTILITGGVFQWNLVVGWNQVCVPMMPLNNGSNAYFGAFDALREVWQDLGGAGYSMANRTGGNPSSYDVFDNGSAEGGALDFRCDYVHGYWIYSTRVGVVQVSAQNITNSVTDASVQLAVGWNLLGFAHNQLAGGPAAGGWFVQPTAAAFATGVVDGDLNIAGTNAKIVATWWVGAAQWYNSYVYTDTFPGMVSKNWVYDTTYAYGYFIWSDEADIITFNVNY